MPQNPTRRPTFPPGTPTRELRFTVSEEQADMIRAVMDEHDVSLSSLVVAAVLSPDRALTVREKGELVAEITGTRDDLGRVKMLLDCAVKEHLLHRDTADHILVEVRSMNGRLRAATERLA